MPFIETTTSKQTAAYDSEGYQHLTRTFKVWGVEPMSFFANIADIPNANANATPPDNTRMPKYGDVMATPDGPRDLLNGQGVFTSLQLMDYILQPVSAIMFMAVARYTNDPKRSTLGQNYTCQQLSSLVPIPYVRAVPCLSAPTGYSYTESTINAAMGLRRVSQTVTMPRSQIKAVNLAAGRLVNQLHDLDGNKWPYKFEGYDMRMRGVQWVDIVYHWTWESGVKMLALEGRQKVRNSLNAEVATVQATYPPLTASLSDYIVSSGTPNRPTDSILHPFHTIEMLWTLANSDTYPRTPCWLYRMPFVDNVPLGFRSLPGAERFEF